MLVYFLGMENKYCMTHFISCFMIIDTFPDEENVKENSRKVVPFSFLPFFSISHVKIRKNRWKFYCCFENPLTICCGINYAIIRKIENFVIDVCLFSCENWLIFHSIYFPFHNSYVFFLQKKLLNDETTKITIE